MVLSRRLASAVVLLGMVSAGVSQAEVQAQYGPPPQERYSQEPGLWNAPPAEFAAAQQRGFRDGVDGARKDFENHRPPNPNNRDEFRNPHFIARPDRRDYRFGFRAGYQVAVRHMYGPRYR